MRRGVVASGRQKVLSTVEWFGLNEGIQPTGASAIIAFFYSGTAPITTMTPALGGSPGELIAVIDQTGSTSRDIGIWWVESPPSNVLTGASYYEATPRVLWVRGATPGEYRTSYSNNPSGNNPTGDTPPHQPAVNPGGLIFSLFGFRSQNDPPAAQHPFIDTGVFLGGMAGQGSGRWTVGPDYPSWPINRYYAMATLALNPKEV